MTTNENTTTRQSKADFYELPTQDRYNAMRSEEIMQELGYYASKKTISAEEDQNVLLGVRTLLARGLTTQQILKSSNKLENTEMKSEIFGRVNREGNVDILWVTDGESVTRFDETLPCIYPIGDSSYMSCYHEHAQGITLTRDDVEKLEIEIEEYDGRS
jgi:hypothetical protein